MTPKVVLALSGGLDSTTLLAYLLEDRGLDDDQIYTVGFNYGSKHNSFENAAARAVADHYGVQFTLIDLSKAMSEIKSSLMLSSNDPVPEGHYEAESMRQTVVPGRNLIFTSILAGMAWSLKASVVALAIHAGDHFIYPDCRPAFWHAMRDAVILGTENSVTIEAPFLSITKEDIVEKGLALKVPYYKTRTCYKFQQVACGKCGACRERLEAFQLNKAVDPIMYEPL